MLQWVLDPALDKQCLLQMAYSVDLYPGDSKGADAEVATNCEDPVIVCYHASACLLPLQLISSTLRYISDVKARWPTRSYI